MGSPVPPDGEPGRGIASAEPPAAPEIGDALGDPASADGPVSAGDPVSGGDPVSVGDLAPTGDPAPVGDPAPAADPAPAGDPASPPGGTPAPPGTVPHRGRRRKALIWTAGIMACVVVIAAIGIFLLWRHLNGNIQQRDISGLLGSQPVDLHPQAENILVIGSDTRYGQGHGYGKNLTTDQSDTTMIVHIAANRQWAEVMSIPRDSWVSIPACKMGDGHMSSPTTFKINEAFALGNLYGNNTALGVACTAKTIEQDTGIYIDHFVTVNFTGFESMVYALGGIPECNTQPINDPLSGLRLSAGHHMLTPTQALAYVRARYTLGDGSDLERLRAELAGGADSSNGASEGSEADYDDDEESEDESAEDAWRLAR